MAILTNTGLTIDTYDVILNHLIDEFKKIYGQDIVLTADTPDGQRVALFAELLHNYGQLLARIYNGLNPNVASGVQLNNLAQIQGVARITGQKSSVDMDISVNKDTNIPLNFEIVDPQGNSWVNTQSVDIKAGHTATLKFQSVLSGKFPVIANAIWSQAQINDAITSIVNKAPSTGGQVDETDEELRKRLQTAITSGVEKGNLQDMYKTLSALKNSNGDPAFLHINLVENKTDQNLTSGQTPHSVRILLEKNGTVDNALIAHAIASSKPVGINTYAKTPTTIETLETINVLGRDVQVKYSYVIDAFTKIALSITLNLTPVGTPTLGFDEIKDFLMKNITLEAGKPLEESTVQFLLYPYVAGQYIIKSVAITGTIDAPEKLGTLTKNNITIHSV